MNLITTEDLEKFRERLLTDLKSLLGFSRKESEKPRKFLKSHQVMEEFQVSQTKLYEMRRSGQIPCFKAGGQYLYDYDELIQFFKRSS